MESKQGRHKQRTKENCMRDQRNGMRDTKDGREGDIGTYTNKGPKWKWCCTKKHIEGGHVTKGTYEQSPTKARSGSVVSTKESPEWRTRETYYKVQTITRREGTGGSGAEIPETV